MGRGLLLAPRPPCHPAPQGARWGRALFPHLLGHGDHVVDERPDDLEGGGPHARHGEAVGERRPRHLQQRGLAGREGRRQARAALGLHADHLDGRGERLGRQQDARQQPPPAGRHDDVVQVLHLLQELQPDGARARDDRRVVEAVDVLAAARHEVLARVLGGVGDGLAVEHHVRAQRAAARDLGEGGRRRHHHVRLQPERARVRGQGERVVAGRRRGDARRALLRGEGQQRVARAPLLEAPRALLVLVLEVQLDARRRGERLRPVAVRARGVLADAERRGGHVLERRRLCGWWVGGGGGGGGGRR